MAILDGFRMKRPCRHCPFRTDSTAIRFANEERAAEIEESAYRYGFPCHETADYVEDEDGDGNLAGYYMGETSQHCAGHTIMRLREGFGSWPGIDNSETLADALEDHMDFDAPVFETVEDFIAANTKAGGEHG